MLQKQPAPLTLTPAEIEAYKLGTKIKTAANSLWLIVLFSVVNLFTLTFGSSRFIFSCDLSAFILSCANAAFVDLRGGMTQSGQLIAIAFGAVFVLPYVVLAILAPKHRGAMITATVFWGIDCLFCLLLLLGDISGIVDVLLHGLGMAEFIAAVSAMKKLPAVAAQIEIEKNIDAPDTDADGTVADENITE